MVEGLGDAGGDGLVGVAAEERKGEDGVGDGEIVFVVVAVVSGVRDGLRSDGACGFECASASASASVSVSVGFSSVSCSFSCASRVLAVVDIPSDCSCCPSCVLLSLSPFLLYAGDVVVAAADEDVGDGGSCLEGAAAGGDVI